MDDAAYFRAGVGMMVANAKGWVLAAERADITQAWQAPQGGLQADEEPVDAARRELLEEIGIPWTAIQVLRVHPEWLVYELPPDSRTLKTGRGQVQKWLLLRFLGPDDLIRLPSGKTAEFKQWTWTSIRSLAARAWSVRQPIYGRLIADWGHLLAGPP